MTIKEQYMKQGHITTYIHLKNSTWNTGRNVRHTYGLLYLFPFLLLVQNDNLYHLAHVASDLYLYLSTKNKKRKSDRNGDNA